MMKRSVSLKKSTKSAKPDHREGHRERLRARFRKGGAQGLGEHELLELVLFHAIPRGDVKEMAKIFLKRFGSFAAVTSAPKHLLLEVEGAGQRVVDELKLAQAAAEAIARSRLQKRDLLASQDLVIDYCMTLLAHEPVEQFHALFVDAKHYLIADEIIQRGTVDHAHVYPREVLKRAIALDAHAVILAHNHPSGDPSPSREDIALTKELVVLLRAAGVRLFDHLIIGKGLWISLRNEGAF